MNNFSLHFKKFRRLFSMSFVIVNDKNRISFYESLLSKLGSNSLETNIICQQFTDGNVSIRKVVGYSDKMIPLMRPSFCPIASLETRGHKALPSEIDKGVMVACTIFVQNSNDEILLTRRTSTLRSFPNVWVPPGGKVDASETLENAVLRELVEETGLRISSNNMELKLICAWESAFPTALELGMPRGHHLVLYYVGLLKDESLDLERMLVNVDEVSAFAWLNKRQIAEIVRTFSDPLDFSLFSEIIMSIGDEFFRCVEVKCVDNVLQYCDVMRPLSVLTASVDNIADLNMIGERVSTGTKYGLYHWLLMTKDKSEVIHDIE